MRKESQGALNAIHCIAMNSTMPPTTICRPRDGFQSDNQKRIPKAMRVAAMKLPVKRINPQVMIR